VLGPSFFYEFVVIQRFSKKFLLDLEFALPSHV
jgi:hypothetical protein